eukprot:CAMPEP_0180688820 /NCGR_PEP_ID=MMETSP1037_2-20121125/74179_1 /TAXON_ID=632150 /ORGANISM="Azadinium spinosum, Strain 3D9" /LENGTH=40 /DNA_ID= /DNA_START= /DNA_END= /DNA_ORIENTATION=
MSLKVLPSEEYPPLAPTLTPGSTGIDAEPPMEIDELICSL